MIFQSPIVFQGDGVRGITNCATICPQCGSLARIAEGIFDYTGGFLKVIQGPKFTHDMLRALALVLSESYEAGDDPATTAEKVESVSSEAASFIRSTKNQSNWKSILAGMTALVAGAVAQPQSSGGSGFNLNVNFGQQIVEHSFNRTPDEIVREAQEKIGSKSPKDPPTKFPSPEPQSQQPTRTQKPREKPTPKLTNEQRKEKSRKRRRNPKQHLPKLPPKSC